MVELEEGNALAITNGLKCLQCQYGLSLQKLRGVGTDNAGVMVGINKGVYQILKKEVPHLILIPCVCHSVQLAVSSAAAETLPRMSNSCYQKLTRGFLSHHLAKFCTQSCSRQ